MKIKTEQIGEILQRVYDSEIHLRIGWLWDGGVDFGLGSISFDVWDDVNRQNIESTGKDKIEDAMVEIVEDIIERYPNSTFTKWAKENL